MPITGIERTNALLAHKKTDRIGLYEHFWNDTYAEWREKGKIKDGVSYADEFGFDLDESWCFNYVADLDFQSIVISETEDTITRKDGNGAILRRHKKHDTTPEHVGFTVTERTGWEEHIKPLLKNPERRIGFDHYRAVKERCAKADRFFCVSVPAPFENMHPMCGHENMLIGMAEDPDWVRDMAMTYAELSISMLEETFAREGKPDGLFVYEDMGFKDRPFMSPAMYREIMFPAHKKMVDFSHGLGLPFIMHSCGFIEPLLPHIVDTGIDALQVIEVKAGMDLLRIFRNFGAKIALMGGIDIRVLSTNDRKLIDAELEAKIPIVKEGYAYFLHTDHSVPRTVEYENYRYFIEKGLGLGKY